MKIVFNPLTGNFETLYEMQSSIGLLTNIPCDPSVYVGSAVYINQSGTLFPALADSEITSNVLGITESIHGNSCNVRIFGISKDLFTSLDVSKQYYLSSTVAGGLTTEPPTGNGTFKVAIGIPLDDKKLLVFKTERQILQIQFVESGSIDFGQIGGDLTLDTGDRANDGSIVDQGLRVVEGNNGNI